MARTLCATDDFAHGPIILVVIVWLIWDKRHVLQTAPASTAPILGLASLVFGLLIYVVGRSHEISILEVGALVPILAGVLLAMRGWLGVGAFWLC
jgi:exosortase